MLQPTPTESGGRARWQWRLTVLAWVCEYCGLPDLLLSHPVVAEDLLAEAGFTTRALKQARFHGLAAWPRPR